MKNANFRISKIKVHNFKNFKDLDVELNKFNILIGRNASGKSNFINIFSFLHDIVTDGLESAIAFQGGNNYIKNFASKDNSLSMEIHFVSDEFNEVKRVHPYRDYGITVDTNHIIYKFSLQFSKNFGYKITADELTICSSFKDCKKKKRVYGKIIFSKNGKTIKPKYDFPSISGSILQRQFEIFEFSSLTSKELLLESKLFGYIVSSWDEFISNMGIYNFDPKVLKASGTMYGMSKLAYDGSNFFFSLYEIIKDSKKKKKLNNLLHELLPYLKTIKIKATADDLLIFTLKEIFNSKNLPSMSASDGTINIIAILSCLFLLNNKISIIEEPERNIHSGLLSTIIQLMDEVSYINQIIISTHNSNILDYVSHKNILIIMRDKNGNSKIIKPENHTILNKFKKSMSISYLMNQNMID